MITAEEARNLASPPTSTELAEKVGLAIRAATENGHHFLELTSDWWIRQAQSPTLQYHEFVMIMDGHGFRTRIIPPNDAWYGKAFHYVMVSW